MKHIIEINGYILKVNSIEVVNKIITLKIDNALNFDAIIFKLLKREVYKNISIENPKHYLYRNIIRYNFPDEKCFKNLAITGYNFPNEKCLNSQQFKPDLSGEIQFLMK